MEQREGLRQLRFVCHPIRLPVILSGRVAEETETAGNRAGIGAAAATASADNSGGDEHSGHSADNLPDTERMKIMPEMSALQRFEARYGRK